jgi:hypothetical protein
MYRVIVLYEQEPDADGYAEHVELCRQVPNAVFRHGKVFGAAMGEQKHAYYAEFEFADKEGFKNGTSSDAFMAAGKDVVDRGFPRATVEFAEVS